MKRCVLLLAGFLVLTPAVQGHYIFLVPHGPNGSEVSILFSDYLKPDRPELLRKVAHIPLFVRGDGDQDIALAPRNDDGKVLLAVPGSGTRTVGGSLQFGTHIEPSINNGKRFLLYYHPKLILGDVRKAAPTGPWKRLDLEIVPTFRDDQLDLQVFFRGKPVPRAKLRVFEPGAEKARPTDADDEGRLTLKGLREGLYGVIAWQVENQAGEYEGNKYVDTRHYTTLVFQIGVK